MSSPIRRTKKRVIRTDGPLFGTSERTRKGGGRAADAKNMPVACFLARGRVPEFLGAPRRGVDKNPAPASCDGPVDCRQTPARWRLPHSVPSPFWRTAQMLAIWDRTECGRGHEKPHPPAKPKYTLLTSPSFLSTISSVHSTIHFIPKGCGPCAGGLSSVLPQA